jgi:hypothetical protein
VNLHLSAAREVLHVHKAKFAIVASVIALTTQVDCFMRISGFPRLVDTGMLVLGAFARLSHMRYNATVS